MYPIKEKKIRFFGYHWVDIHTIPADNDRLKVKQNGKLVYEISAKLVHFARFIFDSELHIYVDEGTTTFWYNDDEIVPSPDCRIYAVPILFEVPFNIDYHSPKKKFLKMRKN